MTLQGDSAPEGFRAQELEAAMNVGNTSISPVQ